MDLQNTKNLPGDKAQPEVIEIDLLELAHVWLTHIWIILLIAGLGAVIGFVYTRFFVTPTYTARSTMYVVSASASSMLDLTDLNLGTNLAKDYVELVQSRTMLEQVLGSTGDQLTVQQLRTMLKVTNTVNTRIINFEVTSADPVQAERLANACLSQALLYLPRVMGAEDNPPAKVDPAVLPVQPSNINYVRSTAIGLLVGLVLTIGLLTLQFMLNDTLNSSDDVEKLFGTSPLAIIPENGQRHRGGGGYYANAEQPLQKKQVKHTANRRDA